MCAVLLLGGCAKKEKADPQVTLPPAEPPSAAPLNDSGQSSRQNVLLYLPSADGLRLVAVPGTAELSVSRHSAETLCRLLLDHPGTEQAPALPADAVLSETEAVEVSGNVATITLGAQALRLSHEELFAVCQALCNTVCQFGDVQYVNVLVNGVQPGLDVAASLPAGCFQENTRDDLNTLFSRAVAGKNTGRATVVAALYYPAAGARGILCEARPLAFSGFEASAMIQTLLEALYAGPSGLDGAPGYPDFSLYLTQAPGVQEIGGSRRAVLHFDEAFNGAIIDNGITRSVMVASLVYTLCTFLPGVEGVEIHIGDEQITSLTPSGTLSGAGETIHFPDGLMKRADFGHFLLSGCTLYLGDGGEGLARVMRTVPFYESRSVRSIVNQLMRGAQVYDNPENLSSVMPEGLGDADLLGVAFAEDTLMLNFSGHFAKLCQGMTEQQEKQLIFALVNSLCELNGVKKVQLLVDGAQPETLAGAVYLPGSFFPNLDIVTQ